MGDLSCQQWWIFGGHRFEPRYHLSASTMDSAKGTAYGVLQLAEACRDKTYVRDVCTRCGAMIDTALSPDQAEETR
jgi:hypothetical protein